MMLLGQGADPISGGAGWVGAGLLGLVLGWFLLVRLPAQDRAFSALIESRDKLFERIEQDHRTAFIEADKQRRADFLSALDKITQHCEREMNYLRELGEHAANESNELMVDLRRSLEELREAYMKGH